MLMYEARKCARAQGLDASVVECGQCGLGWGECEGNGMVCWLVRQCGGEGCMLNTNKVCKVPPRRQPCIKVLIIKRLVFVGGRSSAQAASQNENLGQNGAAARGKGQEQHGHPTVQNRC